MNPRDILRRQEIDYPMKIRDALIHAEEAFRKKDIQTSKHLISEFLFCEKSKPGRLNSTQETQLVLVLLSEFFTMNEDAHKILFFFHIFEPKSSNRKVLLLKFILTAIGIQSPVALNCAGNYLLDSSTKDFRISADFNRLLINEITFFSNSSFEKLRSLSSISPIFANALCLVFAETFREEQLPTPVILAIVTEFIQENPSPPFMFTFTIPSQAEIGSLIVGTFFRWVILSEIYDQSSLYSKMHLKLLECLSNPDTIVPAKPVITTKHLENIIDQIERAALTKDPEVIQKSLEKLAQVVQVSKPFLFGNIAKFIQRLSTLPKNSILDIVRANLLIPA